MAISSTSLCSANFFTPSQDETAPTNDINKTVKAAFKTVHTFLLLIAAAILLRKERNGRVHPNDSRGPYCVDINTFCQVCLTYLSMQFGIVAINFVRGIPIQQLGPWPTADIVH